jgi:LuxR family maltose regulon positive regulatory protein
VLLGVVRLQVAGRSGNQTARASQAQRLLVAAEAAEGGWPGSGDDLRALALVEIGNGETWAGPLDQAESHLEQGLALARRIGRPYLEFMALAYRAEIELMRRFSRAEELSRQAIALAERHGWMDDRFAGFGAMTLGSALAWQGRLVEAEPWVQRAERIHRAEANPAAAMGSLYVRGQFELGRGRIAAALAAFQTAQRLAGPHPLGRPLRAWLLHAMVSPGDREQAEQILVGLDERDRDRGEIRIATAVLRLAQEDPNAASAALVPVLDGAIRVGWQSWLAEAFLLEAIARDALGDPVAAGPALERALDLAEADGSLMWFLMHPAPGLLRQHAHRGTAHAALLTGILDLLSGNQPAAPSARPRPALEPLSGSELRVLRYLPTHLSAPEVASALSVSTSTVKTHMRNLYAKLGAHSRAEAVERGRALGMLAPSAHQR